MPVWSNAPKAQGFPMELEKWEVREIIMKPNPLALKNCALFSISFLLFIVIGLSFRRGRQEVVSSCISFSVVILCLFPSSFCNCSGPWNPEFWTWGPTLPFPFKDGETGPDGAYGTQLDRRWD